jgi:hypothetical protein
MKYLRKYKLFDSYYYTVDDIEDLINEVEDRLDCYLDRRQWNKFIFTFKLKEEIEYDLIENTVKWFIDSIMRLDKIKYNNSSDLHDMIFQPSQSSYEFDLFERDDEQELVISIEGYSNSIVYHFIKDYKNDPESIKNEIKSYDKNKFIKKLFKIYCNNTLHEIDFSMLESFRTNSDILLDPVNYDDISLPYNLSDQFKIDITPIFLEKVYKNSGLIFRMKLTSKYQVDQVKRGDKLSGKSIADETNDKLKSLGIENMTWENIFLYK